VLNKNNIDEVKEIDQYLISESIKEIKNAKKDKMKP
jgi:hypothetical protein